MRLPSLAPRNLPPLRGGENPLWAVGLAEPLVFPPRLTVVLDLSHKEEELRYDLDEDCRSGIAKAKKNGLTFWVSESEKDLPLYHAIHKESWTRTTGGYQSIEYYERMLQKLPGKYRFVFVNLNEKSIAAVLLHKYKNSAYYWGGCSLPEALKLNANAYALWSAIQHSKETGIVWFEVGLFSTFVGSNFKEFQVGRYKAQFASTYLTPWEGMKHFSKKSARRAFRERLKSFSS